MMMCRSVPEHPSGMSPGHTRFTGMGAIGFLELRRRRNFIHAAMREAASTAAHQIASGVLTLPTAALPHDEIERWATAPLPELMAEAARLRDIGHGNIVSYSRKVFIPLTRLCRDTCRYCTFVRGPRGAASAYLRRMRCWRSRARASMPAASEALFTLGDKPELKYEARATGAGPARLRHHDRLSRRDVARWCSRETGLLPHVNPGVMSEADIAALRQRVGVAGHDAGERVAAAWRSAAGRIMARPTRRRQCGLRPSKRRAAKVPFTTGILIGIGETRAERIESLLAIDALHDATATSRKSSSRTSAPRTDTRHGARRRSRTPRTCCGRGDGADRVRAGDEHPGAAQSQPGADRGNLIAAGINDWGGVSPVTPDHVNPGSALARDRAIARGHRGGRKVPDRAAGDLSGVCARARRAGSIRTCGRRVLRAADADGFAARRGLGAGLGDGTRRTRHRIRVFRRRPSRHRQLDRIVATRQRRRSAGRGRHRHAVPDARRRIRRRLRCGRRAAPKRQRRHRRLCRQPQHQLHQRLQLRLPVLRVFQGQARRQPARSGLRPRSRRNRAPRRARPGIAAPPKSACRAASIRATPAQPIFRSSTPPSAP